MTLEDILEKLADRTPPGDPVDVMDRARGRVRDTTAARTRRPLAVAAVIVIAVALVSSAVVLRAGDDTDVEVSGGDGDAPSPGELDGMWRVVSTIEDGERRPASGTARLRFSFDDELVEGNDGCDNALFADLEGSEIVPSEGLESLEATYAGDRRSNACPDVEAQREADVFWAGLSQLLQLQDGELLVFTEDGDGLVFSQTIGDGPFATYCALVAERDLTAAFPTDEQWDRLTELSPPEISADAQIVRAGVELNTRESGISPDDDVSVMEDFWGAAFRIEAFQQEHCGVVFPDDLPDGAERKEMGFDDE